MHDEHAGERCETPTEAKSNPRACDDGHAPIQPNTRVLRGSLWRCKKKKKRALFGLLRRMPNKKLETEKKQMVRIAKKLDCLLWHGSSRAFRSAHANLWSTNAFNSPAPTPVGARPTRTECVVSDTDGSDSARLTGSFFCAVTWGESAATRSSRRKRASFVSSFVPLFREAQAPRRDGLHPRFRR